MHIAGSPLDLNSAEKAFGFDAKERKHFGLDGKNSWLQFHVGANISPSNPEAYKNRNTWLQRNKTRTKINEEFKAFETRWLASKVRNISPKKIFNDMKNWVAELATSKASAVAEAAVAPIQNEVAGLTTEVAGLTTQAAGLTTEVAGLTTQVAGVAPLAHKVEAVKKVAVHAHNAASALAPVVGDVINRVAAHDVAINEVTTTVSDHDTRLDTHDTRLDGHDDDLAALGAIVVPRPEIESRFKGVSEANLKKHMDTDLELYFMKGEAAKNTEFREAGERAIPSLQTAVAELAAGELI